MNPEQIAKVISRACFADADRRYVAEQFAAALAREPEFNRELFMSQATYTGIECCGNSPFTRNPNNHYDAPFSDVHNDRGLSVEHTGSDGVTQQDHWDAGMHVWHTDTHGAV